jgi:hypothetical protein
MSKAKRGWPSVYDFASSSLQARYLIETVEVGEKKEQGEAEDEEAPMSEIQWSRKEGCLFVLRRKTRWREEWMRDRALLRDLLQKTPHASPQELAQATGRSVS